MNRTPKLALAGLLLLGCDRHPGPVDSMNPTDPRSSKFDPDAFTRELRATQKEREDQDARGKAAAKSYAESLERGGQEKFLRYFADLLRTDSALSKVFIERGGSISFEPPVIAANTDFALSLLNELDRRVALSKASEILTVEYKERIDKWLTDSFYKPLRGSVPK